MTSPRPAFPPRLPCALPSPSRPQQHLSPLTRHYRHGSPKGLGALGWPYTSCHPCVQPRPSQGPGRTVAAAVVVTGTRPRSVQCSRAHSARCCGYGGGKGCSDRPAPAARQWDRRQCPTALNPHVAPIQDAKARLHCAIVVWHASPLHMRASAHPHSQTMCRMQLNHPCRFQCGLFPWPPAAAACPAALNQQRTSARVPPRQVVRPAAWVRHLASYEGMREEPGGKQTRPAQPRLLSSAPLQDQCCKHTNTPAALRRCLADSPQPRTPLARA